MRFILLYILTLVLWVGGNALIQVLFYKLLDSETPDTNEMENVEDEELKQLLKSMAATSAYYLLFAAAILLVVVFPAMANGGIQTALIKGLVFGLVCHTVGLATNLKYTMHHGLLHMLSIAAISICVTLLTICADYYVARWIY